MKRVALVTLLLFNAWIVAISIVDIIFVWKDDLGFVLTVPIFIPVLIIMLVATFSIKKRTRITPVMIVLLEIAIAVFYVASQLINGYRNNGSIW